MSYYSTLFPLLARRPRCTYLLTPVPFRQTSQIFVGADVYRVEVLHEDDDHQLIKFTLDIPDTIS